MDETTTRVHGPYFLFSEDGAEAANSLDDAYEKASDKLVDLIDKNMPEDKQVVYIAKVLARVEPKNNKEQ